MTKRYFEGFETTEQNQYEIHLAKHRLDEERDMLSLKFPLKKFKDYEIEINALYREIPKILFKEKVILIHGVLVSMDEKGYLFTAPSGTGKSTHGELWTKAFPCRARIINGDKPLLKLTDTGVIAFGSPWKGKEKIGTTQSVQLKTICLLHRGVTNSIKKVAFDSNSLLWLLQQSQIVGMEFTTTDRIRWFKSATQFVPLYEMNCNISEDAAKIAYNGFNCSP